MLKANLTADENVIIRVIADNLATMGLYEVVNRHSLSTLGFGEWCRQNREVLTYLNLKTDSGSTKLVFFCDDLPNWVIKIPLIFNQYTSEGCKQLTDYCEAEALVYEDAVKFELASYLAPMYYFDTIHNLPIYLQRKVVCDESLNEDAFYNHCSKEMCKEDYEDEDDYWADIADSVEYMEDADRLYAIFGDDADALVRFFEDRYINDFHAANFGTYNNYPVVIDYSGY